MQQRAGPLPNPKLAGPSPGPGRWEISDGRNGHGRPSRPRGMKHRARCKGRAPACAHVPAGSGSPSPLRGSFGRAWPGRGEAHTLGSSPPPWRWSQEGASPLPPPGNLRRTRTRGASRRGLGWLSLAAAPLPHGLAGSPGPGSPWLRWGGVSRATPPPGLASRPLLLEGVTGPRCRGTGYSSLPARRPQLALSLLLPPGQGWPLSEGHGRRAAGTAHRGLH